VALSVLTVAGLWSVSLAFDAAVGGRCDAQCLVGLLNQAVRYAAPIALAALCGVVSERSGIVTIGIEGMMLTGAMLAYATNIFVFVMLQDAGMPAAAAGTASRAVALAAALAGSAMLALLHAVVCIRFRANQIVSGTVVNILAIGITGYAYRQYLSHGLPAGPGTFAAFDIPLLADLPGLGAVFFSGQKPITALVPLLVVALWFVLSHTPWGLRMRAAGENPRAAATLGIDVRRVRYVSVVAGGLIAGAGGAWFTLEAVDVFSPMMTNGLGFIGLAAMIFGRWSPLGAWVGALTFGLGSAVTTAVSVFRPDIPSQLPQMVPYVLTVAVLAGFAGRAVPPAASGVPYEEEP
jgi:simple sugar transport system permease protein